MLMLYEKGKPWSEKVSRSMEKKGKKEIMGKAKKWSKVKEQMVIVQLVKNIS